MAAPVANAISPRCARNPVGSVQACFAMRSPQAAATVTVPRRTGQPVAAAECLLNSLSARPRVTYSARGAACRAPAAVPTAVISSARRPRSGAGSAGCARPWGW